MTIIRAIIMVAAFSVSLSVAAGQDYKATLSVRGEALIKVRADQVTFSVAAETIGKTAEKALRENNRIMAKVRHNLELEGITPKEYKTSNFSVIPQWLPRPRQADSNWKPVIISYMVRDQLRIESIQLEKIGRWIQVATEAGANKIGQIAFTLKDADQYRAEAIGLAVKKARGYAEAAAMAAGARVGSVSSMQVDGASIQPQYPVRQERMTMAMSDAPVVPPQITAGDIEVRSNVTVVYLIKE
ncbi:MAG: SIMPL domain-containing protein [Motiliproteus sp.]